MNAQQKLCKLFGSKYPIVQGGMVWVSGGKLAAAASNTGILGLVGAGSMNPELLKSQIQKAKGLTERPFGVNLPLLYDKVDQQIEVALSEGIKIFFTSAGSPKKFTKELQKEGCVVVHVTSSPTLALKCQDAGVDAIVCEGFEAGGHNGRDETTTLTLIPSVKKLIDIPLIAAGGISSGKSMLACFNLGADGVQIGSLFAASAESSAHQNFKQAIVEAGTGDTKLCLKSHVPVRLLKNEFFMAVEKLEQGGGTTEELVKLLGKGRAKKGMLEGDLSEGELEIGQVSAHIESIRPMAEIVKSLLAEYNQALETSKGLQPFV